MVLYMCLYYTIKMSKIYETVCQAAFWIMLAGKKA
jgi:hypothetical protein